MPGHNHFIDCTCGWCLKYRSQRKVSAPQPKETISFGSFTIPNARCPVCGEVVFYYQNAYGSSVFFDELGPPWPKHPCTDRVTKRSAKNRHRKIRLKRPRKIYGWSIAGLIPVELMKFKTEDDWTVLYFEKIEDRSLVRVLSLDSFIPADELPCYLTADSPDGFCQISYLDETLTPSDCDGWKYARWFISTPQQAINAVKAARAS